MINMTVVKRPFSTPIRMLIGSLFPVSTFIGIELILEGVVGGIMGATIYMLVLLTLGMVMIVSGPVILGLANAPWRRALEAGIGSTSVGILVFALALMLVSVINPSNYIYPTSTGFDYRRVIPFSIACAVSVVELLTGTANNKKSVRGPLAGLMTGILFIFVYDTILTFNTACFSASVERFEMPLFIFLSIVAAATCIYISDALSKPNIRPTLLASGIFGTINSLLLLTVIVIGSLNRSDPATAPIHIDRTNPKCGTIVTLVDEQSWEFVTTINQFQLRWSTLSSENEIAPGIRVISGGTAQELRINGKPVTLISESFKNSIGTKEFGEFRIVFGNNNMECRLLIATPEQIQKIDEWTKLP